MQKIIAGHRYTAQNFEDKSTGQTIQFIHKEATWDDPSNLKTVQDGTTNEEILEVLIDRMRFLQEKFPCRENSIVITKLEESLMWLKKRTEDRIKRSVEGRAVA